MSATVTSPSASAPMALEEARSIRSRSGYRAKRVMWAPSTHTLSGEILAAMVRCCLSLCSLCSLCDFAAGSQAGS